MNVRYLEDEIEYTGKQLRSHWIYQHCGLLGDSVVAFVGPCWVETDALVDLVDRRDGAQIYSERMLHFLVEHFDSALEVAILRQRLLVCIVQDEINARLQQWFVSREGDDLYCDRQGSVTNAGKLSVSIATVSPVSTLIHLGLNISSRDTPVATCGLEELEVDPQALADCVMARYEAEIHAMSQSRCKVRGVA